MSQVELLASIWAFGFRFFKSWFHCLDATVITVGFVIDVLLKGILEEIGSLVVILRLWRVMKVCSECPTNCKFFYACLTRVVDHRRT